MTIRKKRRAFAIPVNAMCDVAFLLLIFIILVSLINNQRVVDINYPIVAKAPEVNAQTNCEITVDRDNAFFLNGVRTDLQGVQDEITHLYTTAPDTRIHIIADRETEFSQVDAVLQILQLLQYRQVSFVVKDEET
jgi:biopolymer transport protein ExbD